MHNQLNAFHSCGSVKRLLEYECLIAQCKVAHCYYESHRQLSYTIVRRVLIWSDVEYVKVYVSWIISKQYGWEIEQKGSIEIKCDHNQQTEERERFWKVT